MFQSANGISKRFFPAQAFSSSEIQLTKNRLSKLQELQTQLNSVWKSVRWIMDVIAFARDRGTSVAAGQVAAKHPQNLKCQGLQPAPSLSNMLAAPCSSSGIPGVSMKHLLALTRKKESSKKSPNRLTKSKCLKENHQHMKCEKRSLLHIPDSPKDPKLLKSNVSRGSWPGPGVENGVCLLESSFSKSEQHLNVSKDDEDMKNYSRKYSGSDCSGSSHYVTIQTASNSSIGNQSIGNFERNVMTSKYFLFLTVAAVHSNNSSHFCVVVDIGNRLPFSKSEDHLLIADDFRLFNKSRDHRDCRMRSNPMSTMSVSATNSPLLPPKNLCNLVNSNADSSLSIANTNASGSLHSISSDESTAAVVSLPVTVPMRNRVGSGANEAVQHSASLLSLAKPIIPVASGAFAKPTVPVTSSLNSLTEKPAAKRTVNPPTTLITTGSILSGNTIPVNINQIPARNSDLIDVSNHLDRHISSSLPSFNPLTSGSLIGRCKSPVRQRQSPVKSPSNAVPSLKRIEMEPFIHTNLPSDIDLLHHPGVPTLDSPGSCTAPSASIGGNVSDQFADPGILAGPVNENDGEDVVEDLKVPTPTSGVLQVN